MDPRRRFLSTSLSRVGIVGGRGIDALAAPPTDEGVGWPIASPASQGIDAAALQAVFDGARRRGPNSR